MSGTTKKETPKTRAAKLGVSVADVAGKTPAYLRALAAVEYDADAKTDGGYSLPARAKREISKMTGIAPAKLASYVDPLYFRRNGERNPLPLPKTRTEKTLAVAVRKRRDAGGTLGRWESVASALAVSLGRPVSEVAVRALYSKTADLEASYVGRGTRAAAPKTRADDAAEVVAAAK